MSQLTTLSENREIHEKKGKALYRSNKHFRKLVTLMEHPEFREFYDSYMKDWDTMKTIVMFMKVYEAIEKHSKIELTPYQKLSLVQEVIDDGQMREKVCSAISEWLGETKRNERIKAS